MSPPISNPTSVDIYPHPTAGTATIAASTTIVSITIYAPDGKHLLHAQPQAAHHPLNTQPWPSGSHHVGIATPAAQ
ncbi:MAG: hypothetical protein HUK17_03520 [Bacteroidales bacterium]|nr:hypothetical protein [Bacteroidales bacterium]MCF0211948.1 hypothetical protein [Bacteroidales bacterium]